MACAKSSDRSGAMVAMIARGGWGVLCGAMALAVCGCSSGGWGKSSSEGGARPVVAASAAETAPASVQGLAFFDELETRSLISHDDALEGVLLVATGRSSASYGERVEAAKSLGLVAPSFSRPAREATTIGEVSLMSVRVLDRTPDAPTSPEAAVRQMVALGILPPPARTHQGLTGAQLVSILGQVEDRMREAGLGRMSSPTRGQIDAQHPTRATLDEPLPLLGGTGASNGPAVQATTEREAATKAQLEAQLRATTLRETAGKRGLWFPGQGSGSGSGSGNAESGSAANGGAASEP